MTEAQRLQVNLQIHVVNLSAHLAMEIEKCNTTK